jgi:predicted SnoaL-like aldol condensation-catalyzing enzyme
MKNKIITILLAAMITAMPVSVFAEDQQGGSNATKTTEQPAVSKDQKQELSDKDKGKVVDLLKSIETGASEPVGYINPNKYIQHNIGAEDGLAGFGKLLSALPANSAKVNTVRVFQDGDYAVAQTEYNFFEPKAGFDIFRFGEGNFVLVVSEGSFGGKHTSYYDLFRVENNKISKHWDAMEEILEVEQWKNQNGKF